jgi:hypothetical protein
MNRILGDPAGAEELKAELVADPVAVLTGMGIPASYHGAVLSLLGAPTSVTLDR